ncbi:MAG: hypothetical protein AB7I42_22790 [Bradyrhizobium sp.]|uniref:hypothetical protein n=1 Tax=Bradyrhizobium sp. TaxID=376 RepID=UPI003D0DE534
MSAPDRRSAVFHPPADSPAALRAEVTRLRLALEAAERRARRAELSLEQVRLCCTNMLLDIANVRTTAAHMRELALDMRAGRLWRDGDETTPTITKGDRTDGI